MVPRFRCLFFLLSTAVAVVPGLAADFWLRPDRFAATPGATLAAEIAVLGAPVVPVLPAIARVSLALAGSAVPVGIEPGVESQRGQRVSATFVRPGWAVWSVDVSPPGESLAGSELEERLYSLHAPPSFRERIVRPNSDKMARIVSLFTVKCIARIGEPDPADQSWSAAEPSGWDLALQTAPSELRVGQSANFCVLGSGRPAAGTVVSLRSLSGEREITAQTRADGSVSLVVPASGMWLVSAAHVQLSSTDDSRLEVRSVSLVFEVL